MSEYRRCPRCGQYGWRDRHHCQPLWHAVLVDDLEAADEFELWREVHARNAQEAAEVYAQTVDREEAIFTTQAQHVAVRGPDGSRTYWEVCAELDPVYSANPFTPDDA